ncbi:MAG: 2,3,4,5-tetrahydropyridine-2,6-dicarboxylate N-acetyltransferase [Eggerthellaceae bacterium]|nr:2,3,4,5-tetrahydropyridine-2,6-dicarboxylate N-acetyltransferase [Eggerthellaceae bacterium]
MNAEEIINLIATSPKKTPVKLYIKEKPEAQISYGNAKVFGVSDKIVFGNWDELAPIINEKSGDIEDIVIENDRRNSGVEMLDIKNINARIEPGAIIRDKVEIGDNAVIMMGAVINIGSVIGAGTMIDMNATLGGRAIVGKNCHVGAGAVLAGVVEPASATPVTIGDNVMIGANVVVLEGVHVGSGAVIAAGAVVVQDVPENAVVAGVPAKVIKIKDEQTEEKTALVDALRTL